MKRTEKELKTQLENAYTELFWLKQHRPLYYKNKNYSIPVPEFNEYIKQYKEVESHIKNIKINLNQLRMRKTNKK